jgi:hypothetical protein
MISSDRHEPGAKQQFSTSNRPNFSMIFLFGDARIAAKHDTTAFQVAPLKLRCWNWPSGSFRSAAVSRGTGCRKLRPAAPGRQSPLAFYARTVGSSMLTPMTRRTLPVVFPPPVLTRVECHWGQRHFRNNSKRPPPPSRKRYDGPALKTRACQPSSNCACALVEWGVSEFLCVRRFETSPLRGSRFLF